jgi:hypothetical protein
VAAPSEAIDWMTLSSFRAKQVPIPAVMPSERAVRPENRISHDILTLQVVPSGKAMFVKRANRRIYFLAFVFEKAAHPRRIDTRVSDNVLLGVWRRLGASDQWGSVR